MDNEEEKSINDILNSKSFNDLVNSSSTINNTNISDSTTLGSSLGTFGGYNIYNNNWSTSTWNINFNFKSENMAIDIEKIMEFEIKKRELLERILERFISESDYNMKELLYNTLDSYGLITDKKTLERRSKISGVFGDDENE